METDDLTLGNTLVFTTAFQCLIGCLELTKHSRTSPHEKPQRNVWLIRCEKQLLSPLPLGRVVPMAMWVAMFGALRS